MQLNQFLRGIHEDLDVWYVTQSYFNPPKKSIQNNSNIMYLCKKTLRRVENFHGDFAGVDVSFEELKELCH